MDREFICEYLKSAGYGESLLIDGYDDAIIGISDGHVCYSFTKMIETLVNKDGMTEQDALDYFYFNTAESLVYQSSEVKPIIVYDDFIE